MKFKPKHERKFWRMAGGTPVSSTQFNDGMAEVARLFQALQPRLTVSVDDSESRLHRAADRQSRIPAIYVPASWRNTTPVDDSTDEIGIAFETRDGIIRCASAWIQRTILPAAWLTTSIAMRAEPIPMGRPPCRKIRRSPAPSSQSTFGKLNAQLTATSSVG